MINSVTIVGNMVSDMDLRYSQSGTAVGNFRVAVQRNFKNQNGEREADFINVVQFKKGAELTAQYTKKGSKIGVTGRLQTRTYENNEGRTVYVTEVVADNVAFLDSKSDKKETRQNEFEEEGDQVDDSSLPF